jgi:hypothetical protein
MVQASQYHLKAGQIRKLSKVESESRTVSGFRMYTVYYIEQSNFGWGVQVAYCNPLVDLVGNLRKSFQRYLK